MHYEYAATHCGAITTGAIVVPRTGFAPDLRSVCNREVRLDLTILDLRQRHAGWSFLFFLSW